MRLRFSEHFGWVIGVMVLAGVGDAAPEAADPVTVHVFHRNAIHFTPDDSTRYDAGAVTSTDKGREINRTIRLPEFNRDRRIVARVRMHPIPKDAASPHDKWDRAGNVRLVEPGRADVEIVKFITAYGGETTHEVDVTHLAPLLTGECTIRGFVDTWVTPAWKMDFQLTYEPIAEAETPEWMAEWIDEEDPGAPDWAVPMVYTVITREMMDRGSVTAPVTIPPGAARVVLDYYVSGHCTDGTGADEFVPRDNVILIDGEEVHRYRPWRDDCRQFRDVNPHCRRWFDGSWSADYSRSGWCPGDAVLPESIDVTSELGAGVHELGFRIEDVRPKDDSGHGYWRVSAVIIGWNR